MTTTTLHYSHEIQENTLYKLPINRSVWKVGLQARIVTSNALKNFPVVRGLSIMAIEFFKSIGCTGEAAIRFCYKPSFAKGKELGVHLFFLLTLGLGNAMFYSNKQQEQDLMIGKNIGNDTLSSEKKDKKKDCYQVKKTQPSGPTFTSEYTRTTFLVEGSDLKYQKFSDECMAPSYFATEK